MRVKRAKLAWEEPEDKYQEDPRWKRAKELAKQGKFEDCHDLVCRINKDNGENCK